MVCAQKRPVKIVRPAQWIAIAPRVETGCARIRSPACFVRWIVRARSFVVESGRVVVSPHSQAVSAPMANGCNAINTGYVREWAGKKCARGERVRGVRQIASVVFEIPARLLIGFLLSYTLPPCQ